MEFSTKSGYQIKELTDIELRDIAIKEELINTEIAAAFCKSATGSYFGAIDHNDKKAIRKKFGISLEWVQYLNKYRVIVN